MTGRGRHRLLMVGYGSIARAHTASLAGMGVGLDSIYGRDPARAAAFAAEFGYIRSVSTLAEGLARPEIDIVVICSPSGVHAEQTEAALAAGKHVLTEIPLALSYDQAERLAALARQSGRVLMVAHTHRYYRAMQEARRQIASGELAVHSIISRYAFLRRKNEDWQGRPRTWTDNLLWHHGGHAVDSCLWLLGVDQPGQVEVTGRLAWPDQNMGIPMDLSITIRTPQDQLVSVAMSYNTHISVYDYLIIGREDTLQYANRQLVSGRHGLLIDSGNQASEGQDGNRLQDQEFLAAIADGRPAAISAEAVLPALDVLQRLQTAWAATLPPGAVHPIAP